jgi:hypothetical protein
VACLSSKLKVASKAGLVAAGVILSATSSAEALTFNDINPIYSSRGDETAINVSILGAPTSFGYFFEIDQHFQTLNGLGFAAPISFTGGNYEVTLWSYANGRLDLTADYTQLSTATFNQACTGCILKDFFLWRAVAPVPLDKTIDDPLTGYVITAIGNFAPGQQVVYYDGSGTFASTAIFDGAGYNFTIGDGYPIPFGDSLDIVGDTNAFAFFNANASVVPVPGPLPIFGAAAAFGWSRKLRRRIKISGQALGSPAEPLP